MKYEIKLRDYNIHLLTKVSYKPNYTHTTQTTQTTHTSPTTLHSRFRDLVPIR